MGHALFSVAHLLLNVLWWIIVIQFVISLLFLFNALNPSSGGVRAFAAALDRITEPLYRPIRKVLPDFGGIDFSPLVALLIIIAIQMLLGGLARDLMLSGAA